jgi:hypothetical protein
VHGKKVGEGFNNRLLQKFRFLKERARDVIGLGGNKRALYLLSFTILFFDETLSER